MFKREWGEELSAFADEEGRKEAIDSIMSNRHRIAHGKNSDVSMAKIKDYLRKSIQFIEFVEQQCRR